MTDTARERNIYLHDVPLDEALANWHEALQEQGLWQPLGAETIPLIEALHRVTAEPVWARISSPHYHASAMDGYAVRSEETRGATETSPVLLRLGEQAVPVDTGDPLPDGMNAVIMIEHTQRPDGKPGWKQATTSRFCPAPRRGRTCGPWARTWSPPSWSCPPTTGCDRQDLGAIAGSGHTEVSVYRRPRVAIQPTGTELVAPGSEAATGRHHRVQFAHAGRAGRGQPAASSRGLPIVSDDYDSIRDAVQQALETHDLVAINAGSSAGSEDYTSAIVRELGELRVHGIAVRPGHPVVLGVARARRWSACPAIQSRRP